MHIIVSKANSLTYHFYIFRYSILIFNTLDPKTLSANTIWYWKCFTQDPTINHVVFILKEYKGTIRSMKLFLLQTDIHQYRMSVLVFHN